MAVVRNYENPLDRASYAEQAVQGGLLSSVDTSGMQYTSRGLDTGVNKLFTDILGRDATPEEIAKYAPIADNFQKDQRKGLEPVVNSIFADYQGQIAEKYNATPNQESGEATGMSLPGYQASKYLNDYHNAVNDSGAIGSGLNQVTKSTNTHYRNQDVAQFITKMSPEQTSKLFADVGMDADKASVLANNIASGDFSKTLEGDLPKALEQYGLTDKSLSVLGKAMFSNGAAARSSHSDANNTDYKANTVYDPEKGLSFTGGFIPDPKKVDWMGQIVKMAILGGIGFIAAPLAMNAVAGALGSAGTTLGYAGAMVPNALSSGLGGAVAGGAVGALGSEISGGDARKGGLIGALTGGLAGTISGMSQPDVYGNARNVSITGTNNKLVDSAALGAIRGGISTKANGGDLGDGVLSGAITGGISPVVSRYVPGIAAPIVNSYVNSAIQSSLADDPVSRTPTAGNVIAPSQPVTSVPAINSNRRVG